MKQSSYKKTMAFMTAAAAAALLCSCGGKEGAEHASNTELTYWAPLNTYAAAVVTNYSETPFAQELEKRTGVKIKFEHPAQGQAGDKFNILVASGNLPDIIYYMWKDYPGGAVKALSDGVIQKLDLQTQGPNLYSYLQEHEDIDKMVKTDNGDYYGFPFIRSSDYLCVSAGLMIRQDWLDQLGLKVPETVDEFEQTLLAFKNQLGAKYPWCYTQSSAGYGAITGAYGVSDDIYLDDGVIKYGPIEEGYKEFLKTLNRFYTEGLIPPDYMALDSKTRDSYMLNGTSGVLLGSCGSGIGRLTAAAADEDYQLVGMPMPVQNAGETPEFAYRDLPVYGRYSAISRDCKDVEAACRLLDYGYSEEGHMFFNFGMEGESYNMVDGYPTYTERITANPDGLSMSNALSLYAQSFADGCFIQDDRYMEQYAALPQQQEALKIWGDSNMVKHLVPPISMLPEETEAMSKAIVAINTYKDEMKAKFIMGIEPIEKFDDFVAEMKNRGVDEYLAAMQRAYERYLNR